MNTATTTSSAGLYSFQDHCLELLTGVFHGTKAVSYLVDHQHKPICYKTHELHPSMHREYLQTFHKHDPLHPTQFTGKSGTTVVKMNDLVTPQERSDHPYYREFISPWGVQDIIELFLWVDQRMVVGAALFTSKQQPKLTMQDIKRVESIHRFMQYTLEQSLNAPRKVQFDDFCQVYRLTPKERLVVELVSQGLHNKAIASDLDCSLATVKTHLQHIFAKVGVNSKTEITSLLYQQH